MINKTRLILKKIFDAIKKDFTASINTPKKRRFILIFFCVLILILFLIKPIGIFIIYSIDAPEYLIEDIEDYNQKKRVELSGTYLGESFEIEVDNISVKIPYDNNLYEDFSYKKNSSTWVEGNGYSIVILNDTKYFFNDYYSEKESRKHLKTNSYNEYLVELAGRDIEEINMSPALFKLLDEYDNRYSHIYAIINRVSLHSDLYTSYEDDKYAMPIILLKDVDTKNNVFRGIYIDIFDKHNNYEEIATILVSNNSEEKDKRYFTTEEILFIIESIEIDDK